MANEKWKENENEKFINPYNFVSLSDEEVKRESLKKGDLTGYIDCTLITKTPLAIPDYDEGNEFKRYELTNDAKGDKINKEEHARYEFFNIKGEPVIPGSQIRGCIRASFEAVTNSCMSIINNNVLTQRSPFPRKPGLIRYQNSKWELYEADRIKLCTNKDKKKARYNEIFKEKKKWYIKNADKEVITGDKINYEKDAKNIVTGLGGNKIGYLILWETIDTKRFDSIFVKKSKKTICDNLDESVKNFNTITKMYIENDKKKEKEYEKVSYELNEKGEFTPIWYELVDKTAYLSPACISRSIFNNKLIDLIKGHEKCEDRSEVCVACSLFGMIGKDSIGSSLRFSDARMIGEINDKTFLKAKTIKELASPKISSVEFYTFRGNKDIKIWNYDYQVKMNNSKEITKAKIRGRKFYLHNKAEKPYLEKATINNSTKKIEIKKTSRNSTMNLIDKDVDFKFKVYFEKISKDDLNKLIWLLTIGENKKESNMCHKLGHGKPIGLGSVKILVDCVKKREIDIDENNKIVHALKEYDKDIAIKNAVFEKNKSFKEFLSISKLNRAEGKKILYPIGNNGEKKDNIPTENAIASHQWFVGNREIKGTGINQNINKTLPELLDNADNDEDLEMNSLIKVKEENSGNKNSRNQYRNNAKKDIAEDRPMNEEDMRKLIGKYGR